MSVTRDITCDLIERPSERPAVSSVRFTPHGEAVMQNAGIARHATDALLRLGCLIRSVSVTADRVLIALHRTPPSGVLGQPVIDVDSGCDDAERFGMAYVQWRGITVRWPAPVSS